MGYFLSYNVSESINLTPEEFLDLDIYLHPFDGTTDGDVAEWIDFYEYFDPTKEEGEEDLITFHNGITLLDLYLHENVKNNVQLQPAEKNIYNNFEQLMAKNGVGKKETKYISNKLKKKRKKQYRKRKQQYRLKKQKRYIFKTL